MGRLKFTHLGFFRVRKFWQVFFWSGLIKDGIFWAFRTMPRITVKYVTACSAVDVVHANLYKMQLFHYYF